MFGAKSISFSSAYRGVEAVLQAMGRQAQGVSITPVPRLEVEPCRCVPAVRCRLYKDESEGCYQSPGKLLSDVITNQRP